jgi:hypothetical protein
MSSPSLRVLITDADPSPTKDCEATGDLILGSQIVYTPGEHRPFESHNILNYLILLEKKDA